MKCFVCKKNKWQKLYTSLVKCQNCGFIRAQDKYFKINPQKLYNLNYFSGIDYENYNEEKAALDANFKDRLTRIRKIKRSGKLLEIGCAFGFFLTQAEKFYKTTGIDLHPNITKIAKKNTQKTKILTGEFSKLTFKKKSFDIVTMFDVIEHLKNPENYIKRIHRLLNEKGVLVIETGDIEAFLPKIQKANWRLITPPTHLSYFSKKTLSQILTQNGFDIISVDYVPFFRTLRQTLYRLFQKKINLNFIFPINTHDLIFIVAQKTSFHRK